MRCRFANKLVVRFFQTVILRLKAFSTADAAVSSLFRNLQELPFGAANGLNPDKLDRAGERASQLATALQQLQTALGEGDKEVSETAVIAAAKDLDRSLQQCDEKIDDWQSNLDATRAELPQVKARILNWLTFTAFAPTNVCAWVGVSQISVLAHAWKWCWGT